MNSGEPEYSRKSMQEQVIKDKGLQKIFWQSDYSIVSEKSTKVDGEKGIAKMRWEIGDTSATRRGGGQMTTKLMSLTERGYSVLVIGCIFGEPNDRIGHVRFLEGH